MASEASSGMGMEKVSSGPSESESSYYSSSGSGPSGGSVGSVGSSRSSGSSGSSGSSHSCACAWAIGAVFLHIDSITSGIFAITNDGCGPINVTGFTLDGGPGDGTLDPPLPVEIPEGGTQLFNFYAEGDIRLVSFTVYTDCGEPQSNSWPDGATP